MLPHVLHSVGCRRDKKGQFTVTVFRQKNGWDLSILWEFLMILKFTVKNG